MPYTIYSLLEIKGGIIEFIFLIGSIILIGNIFKYLYFKFDIYYKEIFLVLILYFFYSHIVFKDTLHVTHNLKFHIFSIYFTGILILIFVLIRLLKIKYLDGMSALLLIFSITILPAKIWGKVSNEGYVNNNLDAIKKNNSKIEFDCLDNVTDKPIVLLILDELSSKFQISVDAESRNEETYSFSENSFFIQRLNSDSKQTKVSMPSIFNYNLKNDSLIIKYEKKDKYLTSTDDLLLKLFKNNLLTQDLNEKKWKYHSFGLVDFNGSSKHRNFIYEWDKETNTLVGILGKNFITNNLFKLSVINYLEKREFKNKFPLASKIRKDVINVLDTINFEKRNFYYFHLYMPHFPYHFPNEFNFKEENLTNYVSYRDFTLNKLSKVLKQEKYNNVKLIISGDHGYRWDKSVNPYETTAWIRGFNECNLDELISVQDIGSLINSSIN